MALVRNLQKLCDFFGKSNTFFKVMNGMEVLSAEKGKVKMQLEVKEEHVNGNGTLHGGMICALVDQVSTFAIGTTGEGKLGVSVDLNVSFLAAAFPGEKVIIESEVLRTGKNLAFANVNMFKQDGKMVATGRHTKYLLFGA